MQAAESNSLAGEETMLGGDGGAREERRSQRAPADTGTPRATLQRVAQERRGEAGRGEVQPRDDEQGEVEAMLYRREPGREGVEQTGRQRSGRGAEVGAIRRSTLAATAREPRREGDGGRTKQARPARVEGRRRTSTTSRHDTTAIGQMTNETGPDEATITIHRCDGRRGARHNETMRRQATTTLRQTTTSQRRPPRATCR